MNQQKLDFNYRYMTPKSMFVELIILALLSMLFSCENKDIEIIQLEEKALPIQTTEDVEIIYSTSGRPDFQLNAPVMDQYEGEEPYMEMPKGVKIQIFDSLMEVSSQLTANYAIDLKYADRMEAKEDVVVINNKGEQLNTEHLIWDKKTAKITSNVFVKITTQNEIITGEGLESNQDFTEYKILKPKGVISIKDD